MARHPLNDKLKLKRVVTPTNVANVANVAIQGGQTSHHHERRNLGWANVSPPTNVTTFLKRHKPYTPQASQGVATYLAPISIS